MKKANAIVSSLLMLALTVSALAQGGQRNARSAPGAGSAATAQSREMLIQNATIMTASRGTINGSILIRNGKIAEVGPNVRARPERPRH